MKAMRESADKCQIASFETDFRNKAGELIPVMITGSLIHDDEGNEIGSIGFARDIRRDCVFNGTHPIYGGNI